MFKRNYSMLLEIDGQLDELVSSLCDPHPTDDQLFHAQELLASMLETIKQMDTSEDGYFEIHAIVSRLHKAVVKVRRFATRLNGRWRTTVERALHVLNSVVSSRLSDRMGDSNVRQCIKSLDAFLEGSKRTVEPAKTRKTASASRSRFKRFF